MGKTIKGGIFDLDGVITETVDQHSRAWKEAFDVYNERRQRSNRETFKEFSIAEDYPNYIDGLPRYTGVKRFLESRDIDLPYGSEDDDPAKETICGIGNFKNSLFLKIIRREGVEMLDNNIAQIKKWRKKGLKCAVISSSRNCKEILESVGLSHLFHVRIDGVVSEERNIKGKPAPDIFLEAARDLEMDSSLVMVVEDSLAGIEAACKGSFGFVVGVVNTSKGSELLEKGADRAVNHLQELSMDVDAERFPEDLPNALEEIKRIAEVFQTAQPLLFLDFDGTLAPIVAHHNDAKISDEMRNLVKKLSEKYPTAVVSGRGMEDVKQRIDLPGLYYAGSHGFEISGPGGFFQENEGAQEVLPLFEDVESELNEKLRSIEGVDFERKKFTLAVHYRNVEKEEREQVHKEVERVLKDYDALKKTEGKKVIEIQPALDWHKGRAIQILRKKLKGEEHHFAVYLGDDVTDENAFEYIQPGLGILVGEHGHSTLADYSLKDIEEVKLFFKQLLHNP